MQIVDTAIPEVKVIRPARHGDHRGFFSETYRRDAFARAGIGVEFVQDNHSRSALAGTVRGLHFQTPPRAQGKLVRVTRGAIFDVAVDIRRGSPTFGGSVSVRISAEEWNQIWIPPGFAHGLCTLEPDTEVLYKVTDYYSPEHDAGVAWDDPAFGIEWPIATNDAVLSDKDRKLPRLADLPAHFSWQAGGAA
ncbi:MAG: dTDP-4-dehydrorhamnose 3,5-epimerase [Myxococcales bacterium]|nr:dTDP-4-dehydrorhamnose 3,5-epimerase [Myxococcales bacterium]